MARFGSLDYANVTHAAVRARWYVIVTSKGGGSVFATMGPYSTEAGAQSAAEAGRVVHYRIGVARRSNSAI
jgi:hypothetical protein